MAGIAIQSQMTKEEIAEKQKLLNIGSVPAVFEQDKFQMHIGFASYTCKDKHHKVLDKMGFWNDGDPKRPIFVLGELSAQQVNKVMDMMAKVHDGEYANIEIWSQDTKQMRYRRSPSVIAMNFFHGWLRQYLPSVSGRPA